KGVSVEMRSFRNFVLRCLMLPPYPLSPVLPATRHDPFPAQREPQAAPSRPRNMAVFDEDYLPDFGGSSDHSEGGGSDRGDTAPTLQGDTAPLASRGDTAPAEKHENAPRRAAQRGQRSARGATAPVEQSTTPPSPAAQRGPISPFDTPFTTQGGPISPFDTALTTQGDTAPLASRGDTALAQRHRNPPKPAAERFKRSADVEYFV
ncbi:MAG: hypothetical protein L6R35_006856, partial [Caloplaca aegaea]